MAIYYLDVDDEITSAAQRIRETGESRIALVVQSGSRVASSRINFKLLSREAQHHNRHLSIVAADASIRSLAEAAGLPVFASVAEYQRSQVAAPAEYAIGEEAAAQSGAEGTRAGGSIRARGSSVRREAAAAPAGVSNGTRSAATRPGINPPLKPLRHSGRWIGVGLAAAAATVLASGYFLLPAATVVLTLESQPLGPVTFAALVDPSVELPDEETDVVPAVPQEFDFRASGTFQATGENVLETAAIGKVAFSSANTYLAVPILAGTEVSTAEGVAFTTTDNVTVPKATLEGLNLVPGTAEVGVVAEEKGTSGNVDAGSIVKVPPEIAAALVIANPVTNKEPTTGGTHSVSLFVQQSDIDAAETQLTQQLETAFEARLSDPSTAGAGMHLLAQGARLANPLFDPDPKSLLGVEQELFDLSASGTGTALSVETVSLRELAVAKMAQAAKPGFVPVEDSVTLTVGDSEPVGNAVSVNVIAEGLQAPQIDEAEIRSAIGGMSPAEAETYLARYGKAEVSVWPFWVSTVPDFLDFRVEVRVVTPVPSATTPPSASASGTAQATATAGP